MSEIMLEYVPLLHHLEALYRMPRDMARFKTYIGSILNAQGDDVEIPPLVVANPMAREHALEYVQKLLELGAEEVAARATEAAARRLPPTGLKVSLMVLDDARGGWTSRHTTVGSLWSLEGRALARWKRSAWVTVPCWTSEPPSPEQIRRETLRVLHQSVWAMHRPLPKDLRTILEFEGQAMRFAETEQWMEAEELEYTWAVIEPLSAAADHPTLSAALYGDPVAYSLGYPPLGLSKNAGLALALHLASS
ncbi:MAG: hypothetical protein SFU83_08770 [Meiothermus sp.]|nr:hypothetical protein [Meiothermus sp.]